MNTPLPLDAAALDWLHDNHAHDLLGNHPQVIYQARAALTLAARVAELERERDEARENAKAWESEADSANALGQSWMAHANALRDALEGAVEWMAEEGCDCGQGDPLCALCEAIAALAAHPAASLAAHDAEVLERAAKRFLALCPCEHPLSPEECETCHWFATGAHAIRALAAQAQEETK